MTPFPGDTSREHGKRHKVVRVIVNMQRPSKTMVVCPDIDYWAGNSTLYTCELFILSLKEYC